MRRWLGILVLLVLTMGATIGTAQGQGVVFANSDPQIIIHSTFTGQTITLFGNIEPGQGAVPDTGPYDVIVIVQGPAGDRVVSEKKRRLGIVLNADRALYRGLPGYYAILPSRPLEQVLGPDALDDPRLSLAGLVASVREEGSDPAFDAELIRQMADAGIFIEAGRGATFLSSTTFATRILLPSSIPNGLYVAQVLVVARGSIVASSTSSFTVRTEGFERFLSRSAQTYPILYGMAAVAIAIATGWMGGVLFRR